MHVLISPFIIRYLILIPLCLFMVFALSFSRNALANPAKSENGELIKEVNFDLPNWNSEGFDTIPKNDIGQNVEHNDKKHNPYKNGIYSRVEQMPQFGSGERELLEYLAKNIIYPAYARENGIQGTVIVKFVIDETGRVTDPFIVSEPLESLDEEALWLLNNMPKWNPGIHEGKPVKVSYTLPLRFRM